MKFVIFFETGEYEDRRSRPYVCCDTKEEAAEHAEELNSRLRAHGIHRDNEDDEPVRKESL